MKLWKLGRTDDAGYDEFNGEIVAAETEIDARSIHPNGDRVDD